MFTASRLKRVAIAGLLFFAVSWIAQDLMRGGDVVRVLINLFGAVIFAALSFLVDLWLEKRRAKTLAEVRHENTKRPS